MQRLEALHLSDDPTTFRAECTGAVAKPLGQTVSVQVLRQGTTDRASARLGWGGPHQFGDVGDADQQYRVGGANE